MTTAKVSGAVAGPEASKESAVEFVGDSPSGARKNEAGGRMATGKIVRTYRPGQTINLEVDVTAAHRNSIFVFKVCPAQSRSREVSQKCLNSHRLMLNGKKSYTMPFRKGIHRIKAKLPPGMSCNRCVLQWTWYSRDTKEMYRACSDIKIGGGGGRRRG